MVVCTSRVGYFCLLCQEICICKGKFLHRLTDTRWQHDKQVTGKKIGVRFLKSTCAVVRITPDWILVVGGMAERQWMTLNKPRPVSASLSARAWMRHCLCARAFRYAVVTDLCIGYSSQVLKLAASQARPTDAYRLGRKICAPTVTF